MANRGHSRSAWFIFLIAIVLLAVVVYFVAWLPRHERQERIDQEARQRSQEAPRVNVIKVQHAPLVSELALPGTSLAYTEAYVYARASGYVSRRLVDIGDHVRKGQLLATVDAPDLDQQVAQARSTLHQSESDLAQMQAQLHLQSINWDRYKVLVTKGVFSRQQGDQQEANFRVADANVRSAENTVQANRDNLQRLTVLQSYERVTAPFDGLITARNVDVGTLISATGSGLGIPAGGSGPSAEPSTGGSQGGQMFGLADISQLRVFVSAPEAYSAAIRVGQRVELTFQEMTGTKFEGRVSRTSASIDQNTRTLLVEIHVANAQHRLLPGMFVMANFIDVQSARPLLIPGAAIAVRDAKQTVALIDSSNKVHYRPITIGRDYGDQTEILGGLEEGDVIATTVTDELREGAEVQPQFPKQQKPPEGTSGAAGNNTQGGQYGNQQQTDKAQKSSGGSKGKSGQQGGDSKKQ